MASASAPTQTQKEAFAPVVAGLKQLVSTVQSVEKQLEAAGAPYTPGRMVDWVDH